MPKGEHHIGNDAAELPDAVWEIFGRHLAGDPTLAAETQQNVAPIAPAAEQLGNAKPRSHGLRKPVASMALTMRDATLGSAPPGAEVRTRAQNASITATKGDGGDTRVEWASTRLAPTRQSDGQNRTHVNARHGKQFRTPNNPQRRNPP